MTGLDYFSDDSRASSCLACSSVSNGIREATSKSFFDLRLNAQNTMATKAMEKVKHGRLLLIPASEQTTGHGTTANAKFYAKEVGDLLQSAPRRAM